MAARDRRERGRPDLARRAGAAATVAVLALATLAGCAAGSGASAPPPTGATPPATGPTTTPVPGSTAATTTTTTTTAPSFTPTTTSTPTPVVAGPCPAGGAAGSAPPATRPGDAEAARARLAPALEELRGAGASVGVSVWVDGIGEVAALDPTAALVPASNQKLLVAFAALDLLPPDTTLATTVVATGPVVGGVVQGDLVLVGGGDPTLTRSGPHSLDALAGSVRAAGIVGATGALLVDESRYDGQRTAPGWHDGLWQTSNVGFLSALVVDRNRAFGDPAFLADPALANLAGFRAALAGTGVDVAGSDAHGSGRAGIEVAALRSPPLTDLIATMLSRSDNLIAELLVKELGWRARGEGSSAAGLEVARSTAAARCAALDGADSDGSGLSRTDARSPDVWRRLLEAARTQPWYPSFRDALAVSGQSGTLQARLTAPETAGRVRAKTGSTAVAAALSGYLTASSGASVVFSIVVNGPNGAPEPAIDAFVVALARQL